VALGADQDPALTHGQAALMATLTSTACAGMGPELLHSRFAQLGATLEPRVDGESYGVLVRVPTEQFEAAADLALRCVRTPSRDPRYLVEAGIQLQQRLRRGEASPSLRARAANLVSPRAPGALAPWGDPERIPNVNSRDLEPLLQRLAFGELWAVAVVGPLPVRSHVTWLARRLADLASGTPPKAARYSEPSAALPAELPRSKDGTHAKALAVWTTRGAFQSALGAQLFSRALATMFAAVPGVEVLWRDADSYKETSFAAVALRVRADLVFSLPNLLAGAAHSVEDAWLERALDPAVADAQSAQSAAQAQFAVRAERTARLRLGAAFGPPRLDDARKQLQMLRDSRPGFIPIP
jgi:predicted Zn-dependent peptidase